MMRLMRLSPRTKLRAARLLMVKLLHRGLVAQVHQGDHAARDDEDDAEDSAREERDARAGLPTPVWSPPTRGRIIMLKRVMTRIPDMM